MSSKPPEPEPEQPQPDDGDTPPVELPQDVPDDWLDQKPFDPAGR